MKKNEFEELNISELKGGSMITTKENIQETVESSFEDKQLVESDKDEEVLRRIQYIMV